MKANIKLSGINEAKRVLTDWLKKKGIKKTNIVKMSMNDCYVVYHNHKLLLELDFDSRRERFNIMRWNK